MPTIFTIGHSTRTIAEFVALLRQVAVDLLVDVRSIPRSRTNPQFNADALPEVLGNAGITYCHLPALGDLSHRTEGGCHRSISCGGPRLSFVWTRSTAPLKAMIASKESTNFLSAKYDALGEDRKQKLFHRWHEGTGRKPENSPRIFKLALCRDFSVLQP
jgi:hypothetical protein